MTEVSLRFGYTCEPNVLLFERLAASRPHWHPSHESPRPHAFGWLKSWVRCPLLGQTSDHPCRLFIHLHTHGPQIVCQLTQGHLSRWKDVPGCSHQCLLPIDQLVDHIIDHHSSTEVVPTSASSYHDSCCRLNPQAIAGLTEQTSTPTETRPALHTTINQLFMFMASPSDRRHVAMLRSSVWSIK